MEVVRRIEALPKDEKDKPLEAVVIEGCGEVKAEAEGNKAN